MNIVCDAVLYNCWFMRKTMGTEEREKLHQLVQEDLRDTSGIGSAGGNR